MTEAATIKPQFITFTGADEWTSIEGMADLSRQYPVEWGVLFSPSRQGVDPRYPGQMALEGLLESNLRMAAHLCGAYSQSVMDRRMVPIDLRPFRRIQVNHGGPDVPCIAEFSATHGTRCIAQTREGFPEEDAVDWLFDASGGRGIAPKDWPAHPGRIVGYAGGISPANVADVVAKVGSAGPYWIDMESGVRTDDRFDLALCRQVCEAVYG